MPECTICGGNDFTLNEGFYYCNECQTQSQEVRETVFDEFDTSHVTVRSNRIATSDYTEQKRQRLKDHKDRKRQTIARISLLEAFNVFLCSWSDSLLTLGISPALRPVLLNNWRKYLEVCESSCSLLDCVSLLCLSLLEVEPQFVVCDLVRWAREGLVPIYSAVNELPVDANLTAREALRARSKEEFGPGRVYSGVLHVCASLHLPSVSFPPMICVLRRLCEQLVLPSQLADVVVNLNDGGALVADSYLRVLRSDGLKPLLHSFPPEVTAAASLLATLKLLLGLDDLTETLISRAATLRNSAIPVQSGDRWFVFSDWLHFTHRRLLAVGGLHLPTLESHGLFDPCQSRHRRLMFEFYRNDGVYRDRYESLTAPQHGPYRCSQVADQIRDLFRDIGPHHQQFSSLQLPTRTDHIWRPLTSRLDLAWSQLDQPCPEQCGRPHSCSVAYLLDDEEVQRANSAGLRLRLVPGAARTRSVQLKGERLWRRTFTMKLGEQRPSDDHLSVRHPTNTAGNKDNTDPADLWLHRPASQFWYIGKTRGWYGADTRADFERVLQYWPQNFKYLFFLFARTVEMKSRDFLNVYDVIEKSIFCKNLINTSSEK